MLRFMPENPFFIVLRYASIAFSTIAGHQLELGELLDGLAALWRDAKHIEANL